MTNVAGKSELTAPHVVIDRLGRIVNDQLSVGLTMISCASANMIMLLLRSLQKPACMFLAFRHYVTFCTKDHCRKRFGCCLRVF